MGHCLRRGGPSAGQYVLAFESPFVDAAIWRRATTELPFYLGAARFPAVVFLCSTATRQHHCARHDIRQILMTDSAYLSVQEAAKYLNVSVSYLNKKRCEGGGPVFAKLGTRVIMNRGALDSWVAANLRKSTSDLGVDA